MHTVLRRLVAIAGSLIAPVPAIGAFAAAPALAQEPLFLRIRPAGEGPAGLGGAGSSDEDIARAARARSEAVWQRAEARSRIAIASVCTGCLATPRPAESPLRPSSPSPAAPEASPVVPVAAEATAAPSPPLAQADSP